MDAYKLLDESIVNVFSIFIDIVIYINLGYFQLIGHILGGNLQFWSHVAPILILINSSLSVRLRRKAVLNPQSLLIIFFVYDYIQANLEKEIFATQARLFLSKLLFEYLWAIAEVSQNRGLTKIFRMVRFDKKGRFFSKPHALDALKVNGIFKLRVQVKLQNSVVGETEYFVKVVNDYIPVLFGILILV